MLNLIARKNIQSEVTALSPFLSVGFFNNFWHYYCLVKVKIAKISAHQSN